MLPVRTFLFLFFASFLEISSCANILEYIKRKSLTVPGFIQRPRARSRSLSMTLEVIPEGNEEGRSPPSSSPSPDIDDENVKEQIICDDEIIGGFNDLPIKDFGKMGFEHLNLPCSDENDESSACNKSPMGESYMTATTTETLSSFGSEDRDEHLSSSSNEDYDDELSFFIALGSSCENYNYCPSVDQSEPQEMTCFNSNTNSPVADLIDVIEQSDPFDAIFLNEINVHWVKKHLVPFLLDKKYLSTANANAVLDKVYGKFICENSIHRIQINEGERLILVGDIHGQYSDLIGIFNIHGYPSEKNKYLFNGDLVDRGEMSVAVVMTLFSLKLASPSTIFITRGNHETAECGGEKEFLEECVDYMSEEFFVNCHLTFNVLPLGYIINDQYFVCHGGLTEGLEIDDLAQENRIFLSKKARFLLWNDPCESDGIWPSERGEHLQCFGPDITEDFLKRHNFKLLIRSHQLVDGGYQFSQNNMCLTIFSAPRYCRGYFNNQAAVMIIKDDLTYTFADLY